MANHPAIDLNENLRLGIDAARTGREKEAQARLVAVLKHDPDNIPALLWLAFVLPSPEATIRVLERVLVLDPENRRARAGIRWARERLGLPADEADPEAPASPDTPRSTAEGSSNQASIRQQLLSGDLQEKAKKGVLAHRARRTIGPLLAIIFCYRTGGHGVHRCGRAGFSAPANSGGLAAGSHVRGNCGLGTCSA